MDGPMDQQGWDAAGASRSITGAFANGFPEDWRSLLPSAPFAEDAAAGRRRQSKRRSQDSPTATRPHPQRARIATDSGGGRGDGDEGGDDKGGARAPEPAVASAVPLLPRATLGGSPWGWLIPHNPRGGGPIPLCGRTIVIGREGDVKAPYNPHLSRCHVRLDWDGGGRVYATHLSTTNATWLNLGPMVRGQQVLVEPSWSNGPHQPMGVAPDAPILFVSIVHAGAARAMLREERIEGWCGWSICMAPGAYDGAADPPTPRTVGAAGLRAGGGRQPEVRDGATGPAAAGGVQAEGCGGGTAPKRQRPLTADERGTTPAYPCARANSASEAYCQSCEMRLVQIGETFCQECRPVEASPFSRRLVCCGAGQEVPEGYEPKDVSRGTSFGNPVALPYGTHNRTAYGTAVEAFDTICEYVTENAVGEPLPRGLVAQFGRIHQHQLRVTRRELDKALWRTAGSVSRDGASYALRCRCHGVALGFPCHGRSIRRMLILRAEAIARGGRKRRERLGGEIERLETPQGRAREAGTSGVVPPPGKRRRRQGREDARGGLAGRVDPAGGSVLRPWAPAVEADSILQRRLDRFGPTAASCETTDTSRGVLPAEEAARRWVRLRPSGGESEADAAQRRALRFAQPPRKREAADMSWGTLPAEEVTRRWIRLRPSGGESEAAAAQRRALRFAQPPRGLIEVDRRPRTLSPVEGGYHRTTASTHSNLGSQRLGCLPLGGPGRRGYPLSRCPPPVMPSRRGRPHLRRLKYLFGVEAIEFMGSLEQDSAARLLEEAGGEGDHEGEIREPSCLLLAPVESTGDGKKVGWPEGVTAARIHGSLGWKGDVNILHREGEEDLVVGVVNPTGRMMPYETSGKERSQCRLPAAVALVEHGLVDVLYLPEANVDANGVRAVETYMTSVEDVEVVGAPSSAAVSTMEQMLRGARCRRGCPEER